MSYYKSERKITWFWNLAIPFIRIWGILTAIVLCGIGIDILHYDFIGAYIIVVSFIVFFLEITWIVPHFLRHCIVKESKVLEIVLNIKSWKKLLMYLPFSVALMLKPHRVWLSSLAGAMLMFLAFFHVLLYFWDIKGKKKQKGFLEDEGGCGERNEVAIFEISDNSVRPKEEIPIEEPGNIGKQMEVIPLNSQFDFWDENEIDDNVLDHEEFDDLASDSSFTC